MSKDWWKQRWRPGWSYQDICQGKTTGNSWQSNQDLANLMGGEILNYMVARHGTSVDSSEAQDDIAAQNELRQRVISDLQRAAGDSATAAAQWFRGTAGVQHRSATVSPAVVHRPSAG